jgi:hypothetical protein
MFVIYKRDMASIAMLSSQSRQDITWLGGITEARRVMVMASASDVLVVPHGSFGWWKACFFLNT